MLLSLIANAKDKERVPKFFKGQRVSYDPGFFLHKACSGKGKIVELEYNDDKTKEPVYRIEPPIEETDCPIYIEKRESEIKDAEETNAQ